MKRLSFFIREEMYKRRMKEREFAEFVGVSHSAINRYAKADSTGLSTEPTLTFLDKLAKATETDVCMLVKMALGIDEHPNANAHRLETVQSVAQTVRGLPVATQEMVAKQVADMLYANILKALTSNDNP